MRERDVDVRRFVAIRPGALGDTLLVFPALALLRRAYPTGHITFVARRDVLPLARAWGVADAASLYDAPEWSALFAATPPAESPLCSILAGAIVIAWLADADGCIAANLRQLGAQAVIIGPGRPREDLPLPAAIQLAVALDGVSVPTPAQPAALSAALPPLRLDVLDDMMRASSGRRNETTERLYNGMVALHAGSGGAAKRWPPERFAALAREMVGWGMRPILIAGPQDGDITDAVLAETRQHGIELALARDLDLVELARLLAGCDAYVGNDSGVSHLAGLLGLPTLALFGPTDPAIWSPLGPRVRVLRAPTGSVADLPVPTVADALRDLLRDL